MKTILRNIPNVNQLIKELSNRYKIENDTILKECIDYCLTKTREKILSNEMISINVEDIIIEIYEMYLFKNKYNHQKCINATGVILHTNLGRAILSEKQLENIDVIKGFNNLEYSLDKQQRGSRYDIVEQVICDVTKAEKALVVNNNAAAVMLILNEFASGLEVIISNSELVEIGGSFRIPEIIKMANAKIRNVGTTNKTHLSDYLNAVSSNTGLVAKIHQSNFYQSGFVSSVSIKELNEARVNNNIDFILYEDLASGAIFDLSKYGIDYEPTVVKSIKDGIDLVSFSGDKLLGSIQAGIIVGKAKYIDRLKKNQLLRALRPSSIILNIIEATFKIYQDEKLALKYIPTLKYLSENKEVTKLKAVTIIEKLDEKIECKLIATKAAVGGGCMPKTFIDSYGVAFINIPLEKIKSALALCPIPILSVVEKEQLIIDCKVVESDDLEYITSMLNRVIIDNLDK